MTFREIPCKIFHEQMSETDVQVKSSNNDHYRVRPVYSFIEPRATIPLEIVRLEGPSKEDKVYLNIKSPEKIEAFLFK